MKRVFCVFLCVIVLAVTALPVFAATDLQYLELAVEAARSYAEPGYKYYLVFIGNGSPISVIFVLSPTPEITDTTQCQVVNVRINSATFTLNSVNPRTGYYQNMSFVYTGGVLAVKNEAGTNLYSLPTGNYFPDYSTAHYSKLDGFSRSVNVGVQGPLLGVDTTGLETLLDTAKLKIESTYTLSSWNVLQSAIFESELFLLDTGITQMQVNEQVTVLQSALDNLISLPDSSALRDLIVTAKTITGDGYTSASFSALAPAIEAAETLLNGREYTQVELAGSAASLQSVINGLEFLPDTTELKAALSSAKAIVNQYTDASWSRLQSVISEIDALIVLGEYTQRDIDTAVSKLQSAVNGLRSDSPGVVSAGLLSRTVELLLATLAVVLPVALALFGLVLGINLIPAIIRKFTS